MMENIEADLESECTYCLGVCQKVGSGHPVRRDLGPDMTCCFRQTQSFIPSSELENILRMSCPYRNGVRYILSHRSKCVGLLHAMRREHAVECARQNDVNRNSNVFTYVSLDHNYKYITLMRNVSFERNKFSK